MRRLTLFLWIFTAACTPVAPNPTPTPVFTPFDATVTIRPVQPMTILVPSPSPAATRVPGPFPTITPNPAPLEDSAALQDQVNAVLARYPGDWHILVRQVAGHVLYSRGAAQRIDAASTIKIPIAMLFFKSLEGQDLPLLKDYLARRGIDGRTYEQLLHAMLVNSEEDATFSLLKAVTNSHLKVDQILQGWGAAHTDIFKRKSTVEDMAALIDSLYARDALAPPAREIMLTYMAEYTAADDTRIGVIRNQLPCGGQFYNKRGTITAEYLAVADVAIIAFPAPAGQRAYMIALFAYPDDYSNITYESLVQGMETLAPVFWQAIRAESGLPDGGCGKP